MRLLSPPAPRLIAALALGLLSASLALAQAPAKTAKTPKAPPRPNPSLDKAADRIKTPQGFLVEQVYAIPRETQGSWVSLAMDPKGRIYASDQYGQLYRLTPPPVGKLAEGAKVEKVDVPIGEAQGLLWAFDSLYVVVNGSAQFKSGLYRVRDTNGDDKLDSVATLRTLDGGGEHGPHAVILAPGGKSLYIVAGNATQLPALAGSDVPRIWGEDNLLPRMVDGRGFMTNEKAPGGFICEVDPEGKDWTLESMGYRNAYDIALNREGDLFTYDSDMEWDMNTPWYRPTRVCFAANGADFGYRNGAGKWPVSYPDSLPPVVNVGPGSPTGISFGYGAKFPAKYQDALFLCDWSYGKLYAAHLKADGAGYTADLEEFLAGSPLPLTDLVVNPTDGALYFAVGGRRATSALYRVVYAGDEPTTPSTAPLAGANARRARRSLEAFHGRRDPNAVPFAWPYLAHPDRYIRFAARVAIEFQDPETWRDKALSESDPQAALEALLALARVSASDPAHREKGSAEPSKELESKILAALDKLGWDGLSEAQKLALLRVYAVTFNRFGTPEESAEASLITKLRARFPTKARELNVELCNLLVYLKDPGVIARTLALIDAAPTQEEQMDYARALRVVRDGWTPELRKAYFAWFPRAANFKGGPSLEGFLKQIKNDALVGLSEAEKVALLPIMEAKPAPTAAPGVTGPPRAFVKAWTLEELLPAVETGLKSKRDYDRGRSLFASTQCFACHRFENQGGAVGPDLTAVGGRFGPRDLLESIILPSKVISDQYEAVNIATSDGQVITGRIMNLNGDSMTINTNMLDPSAQVNVNRRKIEEMTPSKISMMPEGLLNTLDKEEVADLVAYLLSRGDRQAAMFH
jgi:putative heme-binding domain-containing protein